MKSASVFLLLLCWSAGATAFFCFGFGGDSSARTGMYPAPFLPGPAFPYPPIATQPPPFFPAAPSIYDGRQSAGVTGETKPAGLEDAYTTPGEAEPHAWRFRPLK